MNILNHIFSPPSTSKPEPSTLQSLKPSKATEIPEIVASFLAYMSQYDLEHRTRGVNRLWKAISDSLIHGHVYWNDVLSSEEQEKRLVRMGSSYVKILHCTAQDKRTFPAFHKEVEHDIEKAWSRFQEAIRDKCDGGLSLPCHTLVFSGQNCFNQRWDPLIRQCHSVLGQLVSLQLEHLTPGAVDLSCVFKELVNLEELIVCAPESRPYSFRRNATITWKEREQQLGQLQSQTVQFEQQPEEHLQVLKLRTFILRSLIVKQDTLTMLVDAMPQLRSFELVHMIANGMSAEATIDRRSLLQHLSEKCPDLLHLRCSIIDCPMALAETLQIRTSFPNLESMALDGRDAFPSIQDFFSDRLTSLEIGGSSGHNTSTLISHLHHYLCQAPLLIHLKAYGVLFKDELFLLNHPSSPSASSYTWPPNVTSGMGLFDKPVWACRNLRTLHMKFDPLTPGTRDQYTARSRRIFGYISRTCPKLEDIEIEHMHIRTDIQYGMLLLSRCKKLRTLKLYIHHQPFTEERDLEWVSLGMVDFSNSCNDISTQKNTQRNRFSFSGAFFRIQKPEPAIQGASKTIREWRVKMSAELLRKTSPKNMLSAIFTSSKSSDEDLDSELDVAEMTTLHDMTHVVDQMEVLLKESTGTRRDQNHICCWPRLERFEIHPTSPLSPRSPQLQNLIWQLRPDLEQRIE
ncbi:hypothetical protein B0O80DRAFT_495217 [Mortierella sp. GBAus27b]|nr:hypothetical protein BGX31_004564 [Mortierella sp. GBA43]KAI8359715.1 hypothetical protein B0O80DRAFT_495217 [Mortierella sp. GBAus27b]